MKITWLGQAGLLCETKGLKIIIDPYLSNSVEKINSKNFRRCPIDESFWQIVPDIIVLTHNHLDHTDPETLDHYLKSDGNITVLASKNAWDTVRQYGRDHNYVMFNEGTVWTQNGIKFTAVFAEHSDDYAIGVIIESEGKKYYVTGDTLYNEKIFSSVPSGIDVVFLPVNGVGNNMNMQDAAYFAERIGAKSAVPLHFGLFDEINPKEFGFKRSIIPEIYKEINIGE